MYRKMLYLLCILFLAVSYIFAEDEENTEDDETLGVSLEFNNHFTDEVTYYNEINPSFWFSMPHLKVVADLSFINDGKYSPNISNLPDGTLLGYYSIMNNGYMELTYEDFQLTVGQKEHSDFIDSDYSLFISGNKNPAFITDFVYDGDFLYYETRWIRLNERSAIYTDDDESLDRGANYKTYALKLGQFRLGFQDAVVYVDRSFDLEYFVNPIPQYFIQYTKIGSGRPWSVESNENSFVGAFLDYTDDYMYFYAQYLMDDFNLYWLLPDTPNNPNKMAYAAGGRIDTDFGRFTFDAALAFKYTFEATYGSSEDYSTYPYEYTYYPSSTYTVDGEEVAIDYVDNYIGFKYGENCLAFQVEYSNGLDLAPQIPFDYKGSLEYVISGSKSPSNPWHEDSWHDNTGTKFLDEDILEHTITAVGECKASWEGFTVSLGLTLGYVFNELVLDEVVDGEAWIYVPDEGNNSFFFDIALGVRYCIEF